MKYNARFINLMLVVFLVVASFSILSYAAEDVTEFSTDDRVVESIYKAGEYVSIRHDVNGDILVACRDFSLTADVLDNVFVASRTIEISGDIGGDFVGFAEDIEFTGGSVGDIRGACRKLVINCTVHGDVYFGAEEVIIGPDAIIYGNVYVGADLLDIQGEVHGSVDSKLGRFYLDGIVLGDVEVSIDEDIDISSDAIIDGDLDINAEDEYFVDFSDQVRGRVGTHIEVFDDDDGPSFFFALLKLFMQLITALILVLLFNKGLKSGYHKFMSNSGKYVLTGLLGLFLYPLAFVLSIVLVVTIPLGLISLPLFFGSIYVGMIIGCIFIGIFIMQFVFKKEDYSLLLSAMMGVFLIWLIGLIPIAGAVLKFMMILVGTGILFMAMHSLVRKK
jgi:cytoskeletal protein CcmA (bactofilin family)